MFRVFVDEFGTHHLQSADEATEQYLGLTGIIMNLDYERGPFKQQLDDIKIEIFGSSNVVLHRREIIDCQAPFDKLRDQKTRERFNNLLLNVLETSTYGVFTAVIDKREHQARYSVWRFHPYHYCLTVLMERYVQWLKRVNQVGDVLVEARGKKENIQLEKAYHHIFEHGTDHVTAALFRKHLTSKQLKLQPKAANISGLQMADIIANPTCRYLICQKTQVPMTAVFSNQVLAILKRNKFLRSPTTGKIEGWGTKWLP